MPWTHTFTQQEAFSYSWLRECFQTFKSETFIKLLGTLWAKTTLLQTTLILRDFAASLHHEILALHYNDVKCFMESYYTISATEFSEEAKILNSSTPILRNHATLHAACMKNR